MSIVNETSVVIMHRLLSEHGYLKVAGQVGHHTSSGKQTSTKALGPVVSKEIRGLKGLGFGSEDKGLGCTKKQFPFSA
jgi:hypothetical protein